jgi:hypothetical protein
MRSGWWRQVHTRAEGCPAPDSSDCLGRREPTNCGQFHSGGSHGPWHRHAACSYGSDRAPPIRANSRVSPAFSGFRKGSASTIARPGRKRCPAEVNLFQAEQVSGLICTQRQTPASRVRISLTNCERKVCEAAMTVIAHSQTENTTALLNDYEI